MGVKAHVLIKATLGFLFSLARSPTLVFNSDHRHPLKTNITFLRFFLLLLLVPHLHFLSCFNEQIKQREREREREKRKGGGQM